MVQWYQVKINKHTLTTSTIKKINKLLIKIKDKDEMQIKKEY